MRTLAIAVSMIVTVLIADLALAQGWDPHLSLMEFNLDAPGVQPNAVQVKGSVQRHKVVNGVAQGSFRLAVSALFPTAGSPTPTDLRTASVSGTWSEAQPNFVKNHLLILALAWIASGAPESELQPILQANGAPGGAQITVDRADRLQGSRLSPASRQAVIEMARSFVAPQALAITDQMLYRAVTFIPLRSSRQALPVKIARVAGPNGRTDFRVLVRQPQSPTNTSDLRMTVTVYRAGGGADHFACSSGDCVRFGDDEQWFGGDEQWFVGDEQWFGGDEQWFGDDEQWFGDDEQWFGGDEHWGVSFSFPVDLANPGTFIRAVTVSVVDAMNPTRSGFMDYSDDSAL